MHVLAVPIIISVAGILNSGEGGEGGEGGKNDDGEFNVITVVL
jgi:hypothetical protein